MVPAGDVTGKVTLNVDQRAPSYHLAGAIENLAGINTLTGIIKLNGVAGIAFALWAPNARRVSVIGEFNAWDGRRYPMRCS